MKMAPRHVDAPLCLTPAGKKTILFGLVICCTAEAKTSEFDMVARSWGARGGREGGREGGPKNLMIGPRRISGSTSRRPRILLLVHLEALFLSQGRPLLPFL